MLKYLFPILCLIAASLSSQNYKGTISEIHQDGFHKIWLAPDVRSASLSDINYFRIIDANENEVPYIVLNDAVSVQSVFTDFHFQVLNNTQDSVTSIIVENKNQQKIDHLVFKIANTKVKKTYSISGSNDQKEWFGLATNQLFLGLNEAEKTTVEQRFSFPINEYRFLKFEFSNKESLPLQILNSGLYDNFYSDEPQTEINDFKIKNTTNKKSKTTQITITFNTPQHIESMAFDIENEVFLRQARIYVNRTQTIKKRVENYQHTLSVFELHSGTHNTFELPYIFEKEIIIEIENNDNPPLNIKHVKFFQKPLYVVSNLKNGESYEVIIDTTLHEPRYDLVNFKSTFNSELPEAFITDFTKTDNPDAVTEKSFWQTNFFMWICIVLAIVVISYFALSLLKDMKN